MGQDSRGRMIDILLVEDNPGDVRLTEEAFEEARLRNELHAVTRGRDALDYVHQRGEYADASRPDIVLLDLNLPGMSGWDVLEEIKASPGLKTIPTIVLTSSEAEEDIVKGYDEHANAYLTKPVDVDEFIDLGRTIAHFWIQLVELPTQES